MADITFSQAAHQFNENNQRNKVKFYETMEEIKDSDFSMFSELDVWHFAHKLNEYNPDKKAEPYTANDIRNINLKNQNYIDGAYAMLNSFANSESDDIFDFF